LAIYQGMNSRSIWILAAALDALLLIAIGISFHVDYKVYTKGEICKVVIKSFPQGNNDMMYFYKDGAVDYTRVKSNLGITYQIGDTIQLKYLPEFEHHFLFINENPLPVGVGLIIFLVFCFGAFIMYAFRKEPLTIKLPWQKSER
jgi:restriction endonuclease S subunit